MSFYRTYRPQRFSDLIGQHHVTRTLLQAVAQGRVHHAYLFTGPRGTGKTSSARILAKAINCTALKESEPCNECELCIDISEGRLVDLVEIDAASNRGIDEMRELREKVVFAPTRAKAKVYIIDEVHMLTKEAFNALLKTLEEPPENVHFILATTEVHKIPDTVLSRCQRFDFRRVAEKDLVERLKFIAEKENIEAEEEALNVIAHHCEGGVRDAVGLLEQMTNDGALTAEAVCIALGVSGVSSLENLYECLKKGDAAGGFAAVGSVYEDGHDLVYFSKRFLEFLRGKLAATVEARDGAGMRWHVSTIEHFQKALEQARHSAIAELPLELAVASCCVDAMPAGVKATDTPEKTVAKTTTKVNVEAQVPEAKVAAKATAPAPVAKVEEPAPKQEKPATSETQPVKTTDGDVMPVSEVADGSDAPNDAAETPAPAPAGRTYTQDEVQAAWEKITNSITLPVAKRSFSTGRLSRVDGHDIVVGFAHQFPISKLKENENRVAVEKAFQDVLGGEVKVMFEVCETFAREHASISEKKEQKQEYASATNNVGGPQSGSPNGQPTEKPAAELENAVMDIFAS